MAGEVGPTIIWFSWRTLGKHEDTIKQHPPLCGDNNVASFSSQTTHTTYSLHSSPERNLQEYIHVFLELFKMGLLDLFIASSMPVLKFLMLTSLGAFLALDHINILGDDSRKHLNKMVFYVFNPALIATNLASTITFESMVLLWFMPVNILITYVIGSLLGLVVIKMSSAPPRLKGLILGCCSAGNMGSMFLVVIPAICAEKGSPFGDEDDCHKHGMAYVSLSMAIGAIYLWSYVYNIVRISASESSERVEVNGMRDDAKSPDNFADEYSESCREALLPLYGSSISESYRDELLHPSSRITENEEVSILVKFKQLMKMVASSISLNRIFAPSTIAAFVGFIVGIIPQVRMSMIGPSAPLHVIEDSASLLGDGSVPLLTLIVGSNLRKGFKESGTQISLIVGIVVVRYILLPLSGVLTVKGAAHFGFIPSNPLYRFILLLQFAVPPALNIGTISQLFGTGVSEYSVIMLWTYALASVSLTMWSTFFMWLVFRL